jgi:hypothetical protein
MQNIIHKELQYINPYVRMCRCTETHTCWTLIDRIIYDHQLVLVVKGHGETIITGKKHSSSPGDLFLIKPGVVHSFIACSEDPFQMLVIHFDFFYERDRNFWPHKKFHLEEGYELPKKHLLRDIPVFGDMIFPDCFAIKNISAVEVLMRKMISIYESEALGKELLSKAYLLELIHIMYTSLSEDYSIPNKDSDFQRIKQAFDYINEGYMKAISVQSLAALCNLSTNYFPRCLRSKPAIHPWNMSFECESIMQRGYF